MTVPYIFANASGSVALAELDANFAAVNAYAETAGTVTANAQPNITSVGILNSVTVTGNITSDHFIGDGSGLANIQGANVSGTVNSAEYAVLATTANTATNATNAQYAILANSAVYANISITSNTANYANVANVANVTNSVSGSNVSGQVANALIAQTVTANSQPNITSVGVLTSLSSSGNVTGNNVIATTVYGNNLTGLNVSVSGNVSAGNLTTVGEVAGANVRTGNIYAGNIVFPNNTRFNSAQWALVETLTADLSSGPVTVSTVYSYNVYVANFNEVIYATSGGSNIAGTIIFPLLAGTDNTIYGVNNSVGVSWANMANASITIANLTSNVSNVTVYMFVR